MKIKLLLLVASCLLSASAQDATTTTAHPAAHPAGKAVQIPNANPFIRVDRDAKNVRLQTGVTTYVKEGVTVDLISAIHIADAKYYTQLNKEFTRYESLLFEMVGGEQLKNGKAPEPPKDAHDPMMKILGDIYGMLAKFLNLQGQKDGINYQAANFVHADLSLEEFNQLQTEKGESLIGFALQNAQNGAPPGVKQPNLQKLLTAMLSGDSDGMKLQLVDTLGAAGDQMAGMIGQSVIIGDRNSKCLKVLNQQITAGKRKLGIFYGAAHFPDMEKKMLKNGYKKTAQRWLTAWDIRKSAPAIPPKKQQD
jgi:hypothetical protein